MTFDDDMVRYVHEDGTVTDLSCKFLEVEWPPPVEMGNFTRVSISSITDEQRSQMTNVFRGALYRPTVK